MGAIELARLTPPKIRAWYADLTRGRCPGVSTAAKAYRLLRTICGTAVTDGIIAAYQHATRDRDVVIATALDGMIRDVLDRGSQR